MISEGNMNIAITGADGYIGTVLWRELATEKDLFLRLLTIDNSNKPYIKIDYSIQSLENAFEGMDCVVHLAGLKKVGNYDEMVCNLEITHKVCEAAGLAGVKKIVFASSISVYSDQHNMPWEESQVANPNTLYGISKLMGEHQVRLLAKRTEMRYTCLRFAHVIGENMPGSYMIPVVTCEVR